VSREAAGAAIAARAVQRRALQGYRRGIVAQRARRAAKRAAAALAGVHLARRRLRAWHAHAVRCRCGALDARL
jgi:hypothetical protein